MAGVPLRRRLPRDAFLVLAAYLAVHAVAMSTWYGLGWDAHAYYVAWSGGLYEALPGSADAYNYSPLFAQIVWPLTLLPWPVFCGVFMAAAGPASPGSSGPCLRCSLSGRGSPASPRSCPATSSGCSPCSPCSG